MIPEAIVDEIQRKGERRFRSSDRRGDFRRMFVHELKYLSKGHSWALEEAPRRLHVQRVF